MRHRGPLLCLAGIACGRVASPTPEVLPDAGAVVLVPPPAAGLSDAGPTAPPQAELSLEEQMARWALDAPRRTRVLYTWTTQEQFEILKKGGPVLQRSFSPGKGFASFDHALYEQVASGNEPAKNLWHEGFAKSRFAWSNAFGAVVSRGAEAYGDILLRITLKPEAAFYDFYLEQGHLTWGAVNVAPSEIGAVWFSNNKYREYVLPNESMIERVEAYTTSLRADIEAQLALVRSLQGTDKPAPAHIRGAFFPQLEHIVGAPDLERAAAALESLLKSPAPSFERRVEASFVLGKPRPSMAVLCKKMGVVASKRHTTFGSQQLFTPTCAAVGSATCHPLVSSRKDLSRCLVLPSFLE